MNKHQQQTVQHRYRANSTDLLFSEQILYISVWYHRGILGECERCSNRDIVLRPLLWSQLHLLWRSLHGHMHSKSKIDQRWWLKGEQSSETGTILKAVTRLDN